MDPKLEKKLRILHNWVDVEHYQTDIINNDFRSKWNIQEKYIAVFAGVMGPSQNLELVLQVAENMQENTELLFLLIGDGQEKEKLQKMTQEKSLSNLYYNVFLNSREFFFIFFLVFSEDLIKKFSNSFSFLI